MYQPKREKFWSSSLSLLDMMFFQFYPSIATFFCWVTTSSSSSFFSSFFWFCPRMKLAFMSLCFYSSIPASIVASFLPNCLLLSSFPCFLVYSVFKTSL